MAIPSSIVTVGPVSKAKHGKPESLRGVAAMGGLADQTKQSTPVSAAERFAIFEMLGG